jgi:hypothetical protein
MKKKLNKNLNQFKEGKPEKKFEKKRTKETYWQLGAWICSSFLLINSKFEPPTPYKRGGGGEV